MVLDYYTERARVEHLKAEKLAHDLEVRKGRYVERKAVEDTAVGLYAMVREGIEDAVERLSSILANRYGIAEPELRALIGDHMHGSLERLADEMEDIADRPAPAAD